MPDEQNQGQTGAEAEAAAAAAAAAASTSKVERPAGIDDAFFDPAKGVLFDKLVPAFNDLKAYKAERDSVAAQVPDKPEDYAVELPKDFKLPDGTKFEVDPNSPLLAPAREFAKSVGMTQDQFKVLVSLQAQSQIAQDKELEAALADENKKLGSKVTERRTTASRELHSKMPAELANALLTSAFFTAKQVEAVEWINRNLKSGAGANFNANGREASSKPEPPDTSNMTPAERMHATRQYQRELAAATGAAKH